MLFSSPNVAENASLNTQLVCTMDVSFDALLMALQIPL
jgi:hypothetical protein